MSIYKIEIDGAKDKASVINDFPHVVVSFILLYQEV